MSDIIYTVSIGRFALGQLVWALADGKARKFYISQIHTTTELRVSPTDKREYPQTTVWYNFHDEHDRATNIDFTLTDKQVYASKEELLESL